MDMRRIYDLIEEIGNLHRYVGNTPTIWFKGMDTDWNYLLLRRITSEKRRTPIETRGLRERRANLVRVGYVVYW